MTNPGRWPANVILDEFTADLLDQQSGFSKSSGVINRWKDGAKPFGGGAGHEYESVQGAKDEGGASRFFFVATDNNQPKTGAALTSNIQIHHGDCIETMRNLPDNSVDAICTDPPYGLSATTPAAVAETMTRWATGERDYIPDAKGFMGKSWDAFVPPPALWDEAMRVLKPGGHLLAFAGSRTQDLMGLSIRLAGFEIRDSIAWMYGSGFPKSLDVSKAIDKAAGAEREVVGQKIRPDGRTMLEAMGTELNPRANEWDRPWRLDSDRVQANGSITAPATDAAREWEGWGTALKPAFEPIVVARKPFPGTVAANVQEWGTGALNIDASRIAGAPRTTHKDGNKQGSAPQPMSWGEPTAHTVEGAAGRWPANVVLDEHAAQVLDQQSGIFKGVVGQKRNGGGTFRFHGFTSLTELENAAAKDEPCPDGRDAKLTLQGFLDSQDTHATAAGTPDMGGASRFFKVAESDAPFMYVAKAPKKERPVVDGVAHATVKPLALMRWLVKLVTPPGGTVLEPFAGSGTTVEACILEGFDCIAIEREAEYLPLIQARIDRQEKDAA